MPTDHVGTACAFTIINLMNPNHPANETNRIFRVVCLSLWALGVFLYFSPQKAEARTSVSFNIFYDSLGSYGHWVHVDDYGDCWEPEVADVDWRPYCDGYWVYTDCGWTWVSDEPWGWATYHYGRWVRASGHRWLWVPGYEWGPAWVSWRSSDVYVGWAPLPPEAVWDPGSGFGGSVDLRFDIGPSAYNFCDSRDFGSRRLRNVLVPSDQNVTIINNTVNVTKVVNNNSTVFNGGPDFAAVNQRSAEKIQRLTIQRNENISAVSDGGRASVKGGQLQVFAPTVRPATGNEKPKVVKESIAKAQIDRGWNAGDSATAQQVRAKYKKDVQGNATATRGATTTTTATTPTTGEQRARVKSGGSGGPNETITQSNPEMKAEKQSKKKQTDEISDLPPPARGGPAATAPASNERKVEKKKQEAVPTTTPNTNKRKDTSVAPSPSHSSGPEMTDQGGGSAKKKKSSNQDGFEPSPPPPSRVTQHRNGMSNIQPSNKERRSQQAPSPRPSPPQYQPPPQSPSRVTQHGDGMSNIQPSKREKQSQQAPSPRPSPPQYQPPPQSPGGNEGGGEQQHHQGGGDKHEKKNY